MFYYTFIYFISRFKRASNLFMFQNLKFFGFRIWPHCEWSLFGGNQWARTRFTYAYTCLVQIIYLVWFIGLLMNVNLFIMEIQSRMSVKDGLKPNITILTKGFVALQFIVQQFNKINSIWNVLSSSYFQVPNFQEVYSVICTLRSLCISTLIFQFLNFGSK